MAKRVLVIGAGVGGLAAAAALAKHGLDVTVLEAQAYAGGCAGTFFHKGYRFDAGATLPAGFYPGGPMDLAAQLTGATWQTSPVEHVMQVQLPNGNKVERLASVPEEESAAAAFGDAGRRFFQWQQRSAQAMWNLALLQPAWPVGSLADLGTTIGKGATWLTRQKSLPTLGLLASDAFRVVSDRIPAGNPMLRLFLDGQLMISAQADAGEVNALYGAAALDLPKRGVVHMPGGMGDIAAGFVTALAQHGGTLNFKEKVVSIDRHKGGWQVKTAKGNTFEADVVIANLPKWDALALLRSGRAPVIPHRVANGMGAFVMHAGIQESILPQGGARHHQVLTGVGMGDGNSVFLSASQPGDLGRAPAGEVALTISTHTRLQPWWQWRQADPQRYTEEKEKLMAKCLISCEQAFPGITAAIRFIMAGSPVTYAQYTGRSLGWVGGYPQTSLLQFAHPRLDDHFWLVGDSIFPGQSTAAVTLGALGVAGRVFKG